MNDPIRISLPMGLTYPTVNAYLFRRPEPVLVDGGLYTPKSRQALEKALRKHGLAFPDIHKVVITHPHVDHVGLAGVLAEAGAEVWLSVLAQEWMADLAENRRRQAALLAGLMTRSGFDGQTVQGIVDFYKELDGMYSPIPPDRQRVFPLAGTVAMGGVDWQVLYAPGHSNRQVCFYDPGGRRLLSADMLLPKAPSPVVEGRLDDPDVRARGLPALLASYEKFRALDVDTAYPGHGDPFSGHREKIDRQVARLHGRTRECLELIAGGIESVPALLDRMYGYLPKRARHAGFAMLTGYLDLLLADGAVRPVESSGILRYQAA